MEDHEDAWNCEEKIGQLFGIPVCKETIVPVDLRTNRYIQILLW